MEFAAEGRERLDKFLARKLPDHSRTKLTKMIEEGLVLVNGKPEKRSFFLEEGASVTLPEPPESEAHDLSPANIPLDVVFENENVVVINKPRGLAAHPARSLKAPSVVNALLARSHSLSQGTAEYRPGIVHRLDKDTTGLMIIAKNDTAHANLARQIETKTAERRYFAVVFGQIDQECFAVEAPLARDKTNRQRMAVDPRGKFARTHVQRIERLDEGTLVAVRLGTGRTHQIRVHMRAIGHPVLSDPVYGLRDSNGLPLQLHAAYLEFDEPMSGQRMKIYCDPPEDFLGRDFCNREVIEGFRTES